MNFKKCSITDCTKKMLAKSYCDKHYWRFKKHGDPNKLVHRTMCTVENCNRKHPSKGKCAKHFEQYRRDTGYHRTMSKKPKSRYMATKRHAKRRDWEFNLTFEEYMEITSNGCAYCRGPLPQVSGGLDRKDSFKGYIKENVTACCRLCNQMKSNIFYYEEFLEFSKTDLFKKVRGRLTPKDRLGNFEDSTSTQA